MAKEKNTTSLQQQPVIVKNEAISHKEKIDCFNEKSRNDVTIINSSLRGGTTKQSVSLIPKLRFKEFEGEWVRYKVGELCDCIVPGRNKPKKFNGNIAWITTPDIEHSSYIYKSKRNLGISLEEAKKVGSKIVPKDSVIISCVGDLGLVAITGVELVINQQLHAFLPSEKVDQRFLMYSITKQTRYIDKVATKTAVPYMNKDNCNSIPIYKPLNDEQQKIASFLTSVDTKTQQLNTKKQYLENYKKGVMQQLFSQQLRFKDGDYNDFENWIIKTIEEVSIIKRGKNIMSNEKGNNYLLGMGAVSEKGKLLLTKRTNSKENVLKKNDLVMPERDIGIGLIIGRVAQINEDNIYILGANIISLTINKEHISNFIYHQINCQNFRKKIKRLVSGSAQLMITSKEVKKLKLDLPSLKEQQKIANYLNAIDTKIENVQTQIEKTQAFKKGLLQQMFV
jgi:type I restriction enzyme S subunit